MTQEFKIGDEVKITRGFYKGKIVKVRDIYTESAMVEWQEFSHFTGFYNMDAEIKLISLKHTK